jgi:CDP-diacylglycerol--glycerol-3-phosphate 3-phosphatidyltransferase
MTIPTSLTLLRLCLIPVFALAFYLPGAWGHYTAGIIFAIASTTDWLDGYLARSLGQTTSFGSFLDPVADKLVVVVALVLLVSQPHLSYLALPAAVIVGREVAVSALREWMALIGKPSTVKVSYLGKVKTLIQMVALIALILYRPGHDWWLGLLGFILIYIAAALTLWTMILYLKNAWPELYSPANR